VWSSHVRLASSSGSRQIAFPFWRLTIRSLGPLPSGSIDTLTEANSLVSVSVPSWLDWSLLTSWRVYTVAMDIANRFALSLPIDEAWPLLSDLGRVAPLMPGVQVQAADAEGLDAQMRVKVGPVTASYKMRVTTASLDEAAHTAVLRASGRELRGQGTVDATVTAVLAAADGGTAVELRTALDVTGRVAQFGGGVMKEVADRLLQQFAERLADDLATPAAPATPNGASPATPAEPEAVDLGRLAGASLAPRLAAPVLAGAAFALAFALLLRRRR
jgi:carbon monoxide dehydrogenase subunit G